MPVASFSSPQHARRHSRLIATWTSTRERIDAEAAMQELDGTGLYERGDWPLASPHQGSGMEQKSAVQGSPVELEHEDVDESAVLRKPEEIGGQLDGMAYIESSDMSDIEGDSDGEHLDALAQSSSSEASSSPAHSEPHSHRRGLAAPRQHDERPSEVYPVDEGRHDRATSLFVSQPTARQLAQAIINGETDQDDQCEADVDLDDESRDIATPIPFSDSGSSPRLAQEQHPSSSPHFPTTPVLNGGAINPRSSIAKGSMPNTPPHRRSSTRSSWVNTTQIPSHRNNVRYSWQSIHDNEPNRPRIHVIKLVSNTATASAGFPTGEAFGFSISPGGRRIAVFNSARLFVLQTNALPVGISQDYALKRRPMAVELTDEGSTMAILADAHTVNIYDMGLQLRRTRTIKLDFPSNCIALAPTGGLLAAAYEGGCEVFSLSPDALPTDRRAVRSLKMDRLAFSEDGSTLLGTTTRINVSSTVVIQVPVFPASPTNVPTHEELKEAWCSELLHPENIRNSSHATFMREKRTTCNERLFAWNGVEDTFGILNVGDMQYGAIDFPVVISPPLSTCGGLGAAIHSTPALDEHGDTVAMIVNDRTIRLYIVPQKVDDDYESIEAHSIDHELDEGYGCPFSEARWVYSSASLPAPLDNQSQVKGRLIVTSPGGVTNAGIGDESVNDIEGGRIILFDFDLQFAGQPGQTFSLTLGKSPPMKLEEEEVNVQDQVALVRRRTVNQSKSGGLHARPATLGRAATTYGSRAIRGPSPAFSNAGSHRNRTSMISIGSMQSDAARSLPDLMEGGEEADAFEQPYVPGAPRSQASLQRAASNAQRHRFQKIEERTQERVSVDSSGGFLPLPEYTEEPNAPLPSRFRAMAGLDAPTTFSSAKPAVVINPAGGTAASASSSTTPQTAPPDVGENFSADQAFQRANAQARAARQAELERPPEESSIVQTPVSASPSNASSRAGTQTNSVPHATAPPLSDTFESLGSVSATGTYNTTQPSSSTSTYSPSHSGPVSGLVGYGNFPPPVRNGTFDSVASMPRSLQRAYSTAVSPLGSGPPPNLIGDWRNVSPADPHSSMLANGRMPLASSSSSLTTQEEAWDAISPITPSPSSRQANYNRYSTSLLNPPGHIPPRTAPGSSSSFAASIGESSIASSTARRMPPHMQAFRNAAAANAASASLFPPTQSCDHVPHRPNTTRVGTVGHPITAWHPPAASSPPNSAMPRTSGSMRGHHSRKSSIAAKSAFANTQKAKKLGFFKKRRRPDPFAPTARTEHTAGGSVMETKSMITWMTKSDNKCTLM